MILATENIYAQHRTPSGVHGSVEIGDSITHFSHAGGVRGWNKVSLTGLAACLSRAIMQNETTTFHPKKSVIHPCHDMPHD